jgi:ribosomal protein RSM22 (predicted rRNA methylase)
MLTAHLPNELRTAIDAIASQFPTPGLTAAARRLSDAYRKDGGYRIDSPIEAAAYAASRMPATFSAISAAFREIDFQVDSILDLGGGTGAAAWAARSVFGDQVRVTVVEPNEHLRKIGEKLQCDKVDWRGGNYRNLSGLAPHDLVVFGYSLGEVPPGVALEVIDKAYTIANKGLCIVEPGTVSSFGFFLRARQRLIDLGATIAAPCPHQRDCPLSEGDWCHFAVRLDRSKLHKLLKGGDLGYEDEKFSYLIALRQPPPAQPAFSRILRHPFVEPRSVKMKLCQPAGLAQISVRASDKARFKAARKSDWGARWTEPDPAAPAGEDI